MKQHDLESSFENYRRDRTFRRLQQSSPGRPKGKNASILEQLEEAERNEVQSETLTREVHEFFADATRTAAGIVQKISETHEEASTNKLGSEIQEFLNDVIRRAELFMTQLQFDLSGVQQKELEPTMRNLVGPQLDEFRAEGTAELEDKHLGQDPFESTPDAPAAQTPPPAAEAPQPMADAPQPTAEAPAGAAPEAPPWPAIAADAPTGAPPAAGTEEPPTPAPDATAAGPAGGAAGLPRDPERLKKALTVLVSSGILDKEEARAMYRSMRA